MAALVLGLHLTPGRRLCATLEKYQHCNSVQNPQDVMVQSLLDVLHSKGLSNSLNKLGAIVGGSKDDVKGFVQTNVEGLLKALVDRLVSCDDFKMIDMGMRHETKLEVKEAFKRGCQHNHSTIRVDRVFALLVSWGKNEILTFAQLQHHLNAMMITEEMYVCPECGDSTVKTVQCSVKEFCDPDFLTIVFARPVNLNARLNSHDNVSNFGASRYMLKSVVHWDPDMRSASVSREKMDGWWWHGVDESQRPDFKYDIDQLAPDADIRDVSVMMMVRIGGESGLQEREQPQGAWTNNAGQEMNERRYVEESTNAHVRNGEPTPDSAEVQYQKDLARAQAISRKETPGCLEAEEVIRLGREAAARLGISCNKPNLPLENNCFIPMDGDCIFSCCCHANDPTLRGQHLKNGAWELRVRAVGTVLEKLKHFTEEQWSILQAIVSGNDKEALSKEEITAAIESYMESGKYSCNVGDLVLQFAASFLQQPILVIRIENCCVTNLSWIEPVEMFGGDPLNEKYPIVVVLQLRHYVPLLLDDGAKEVAKIKLHQWRISTRMSVSQGEELDVSFNPPSTSTQRAETETDRAGHDAETEASRGLLLSQAPAKKLGGMQKCSCGYTGAIANHLRANQNCLQGMREDLSLEAEMSDEVLIVQTTLVLQGCPAFGCVGGDHGEIPVICIAWWKEKGWDLMKWEGSADDLNSIVIKQMCREYVRELTEGFDHQEQSSTTVMSQLDPSQRPHQRFIEAHVCLCNYDGLLADHLRNSKQCVNNLRQHSQLQMADHDDEVFIVKATVILWGCPAPGCPGGTHQQIPKSCFFWWREIGWKVMRWKGQSENAGTAEIKKKESMFRRNFLRRKKHPDGSCNPRDNDCNRPSQQTENSTHQREVERCCQFCQIQEPIVLHLQKAKPCLRAYVKQYLPKRAQSYIGKKDLAMFDLSLMIPICANPACVGSLYQEGVMRHLQGACLRYYQNEGEKLFQWNSALDKTSVYERLKKRKSWLKNLLKDGGKYEEEIVNILRMECRRCKIRGPLLDDKKHKMCASDIDQTTGGLLWECSRCTKGDERHEEMVLHAIEKAAELGAPIDSDDSMKMVVVEDDQQRQRVVFVPACVVPDYEVPNVSDTELNPLHTTVLVPKNPEALDQIGDEASERAKLAKDSLERIAEYFGRRFLVGPVTECVSVFYRLKIAQIRAERLSMLSIMSKTSKGKIKSRNPNEAFCKERKPHFATTQKFCLTNTCSWSPSAQEKRSQESAARACINGHVKIRVDITILKEFATDSPQLRDIVSETLLLNSPPLISLAPLVLNYLKAKVGLLVKHFFSQSYKNWDLDLRFSEREWTVRLVGFLYCEEFEELNSKIASGAVSQEEVMKEVVRHRHLLPTTTTSQREIMDVHSMTEEQAEV